MIGSLVVLHGSRTKVEDFQYAVTEQPFSPSAAVY